MDQQEVRFNEALNKFRGFFRFLGRKYEIIPALEREDIEQICAEKLFKIVSECDWDINSIAFTAYVKDSAKNVVFSAMRYHSSYKRSHNKEVHDITESRGNNDEPSTISVFDILSDKAQENPENITTYEDLKEKICSVLTEEERSLFYEIDQSDTSRAWSLLSTKYANSWPRPTNAIYAEALGITLGHLKSIKKSMRNKIMALFLSCPYCGSNNIAKYKRQDDKWLYACANKSCEDKVFTPLFL